MSKDLTNKPLKGISLLANAGIFDTVTANTIILPEDTIDGLIDGARVSGLTIIDSEIINTVIGANGPNEGHFTRLTSRGDITFISIEGTRSADWDAINGVFSVYGDFKVSGCSTLGNIGICQNTIQALNNNGNIIIAPRQLGGIFLQGPITNIVNSAGNYLTSVNNGNIQLLSSDFINITSRSSSNTISAFSGQTINTVNGDITFNTDTGLGNKTITSIFNSNGNVVVNTNVSSNVKVGDTIILSNTNSIPVMNGTYTVSNIRNSNSFIISSGTVLTTNATAGVLYKPPSNNINLNASSHVIIPSNIDLIFGNTSNSIYGNTGGVYVSSEGDMIFNLSGTDIFNIPQNTKLQLGTSGNNYINFNGSSMNLNSYNDINISSSNILRLDGNQVLMNMAEVHIRDANPMIANYVQNANDLTDRGIEFNYFDGNVSTGSSKVGWFGWKKNTGKFTFLKDATNNNEIFSGNLGELEIGITTIGGLIITNGSDINVNCGSLLNVNRIRGCGDILNIDGSNIVNISAGTRISLQSSGDIYVPYNIPIVFGTSGTYIKENTVGSLMLNGYNNIRFSVQTSGTIIIDPNVNLSFDGTSIGNQKISSDTNGNLNIMSNKNINLITTGGNIIIPENQSSGFPSLQFGRNTINETISGNTNGLFFISKSAQGSINHIASSNVNMSSSSGNILINSLNGDIQLFSTIGNVRLYQGSRIVFGINGTSNSIRSDSIGNLMINGPGTGTINNLIEVKNASIINLNVNRAVNIPTNVQTNFDDLGTRYIIADTVSNFNIINNSRGTINISSLNTNIINTGGTTSINNSVSNILSSLINISVGSFILSGNTSNSIADINTQNVRLYDPILTLANYTTGSIDGKDRGIEFRYTNSNGSSKLGWFGFKSDTNQFSYYSDAINTNEVITGTLGTFALGNTIIDGGINFNTRGNINLNCGTISNVNTILGCNNAINISAGNINLTSNTNGRVLVPLSVPLAFGTTSNNINTDSGGNIIITSNEGSGTVIINANVQINGTTQNVFSTITNVQDPIFSLGGVGAQSMNDLKDRGIEFKWYGTRDNITGSKVGFFGFNNLTQRFTYIPFATNANEIMTGVPGDVEFNDGYFKNLNINCGTVSNVSVISGCLNRGLSLVSSSGNINISSSNVVIPRESKLIFGTSSNSISSDTVGNLLINAVNNSSGIIFNTNTSGTGYTQFNQNSKMYFGQQSDGNFMMRDTAGNFQIINSTGNIYLSPLTNNTLEEYGSVILPTNDKLIFGNSNTRIESDGTNLKLFGTSISINSTSVDILGSLTSVDPGKYIYPLGTQQLLYINNIDNSLTSGNIKITTNEIHYLSVGDKVTLANTTSDPVINGEYIVNQIISDVSFSIAGPAIVTPGNKGVVYSVLKTYQGKDVGIEVNYWSTIGNVNVTAGSVNHKKAFFGWLNDTQQWTYYSNASIENSIVTNGILGNIRVDEIFPNKINKFILTGAMTAGNNAIIGSNFQISGGSINSTPIGQTIAQTGRFTSLSSTVSTNLENVNLLSNINYSIESYTVSSLLQNRNPVANRIISYVTVSGVGFIGTGTMPLTGLTNGQMKKIVCVSMSSSSRYELMFASGSLITPNPLSGSSPTKITFKRQGQSCELMWNSTQNAWILMGGTGAYIS